LANWQQAVTNGYGDLLLTNKIEIVKDRRVTGESETKTQRLSEAGSFQGFYNGNNVFNGPVSVLNNSNGTIWVVSYNTNEILLLNINGVVLNRITGPVNGFDRPADIIRLSSGNLLVSESAGDRLAVLTENGSFVKYIGAKGRSNGQMVCPLYLCEDSLGRIYVSDYGNRRVDVFDKDGNGLFFFGGKQGSFKGLKGPTGIAIVGDSIFVADNVDGCIYVFDKSGNFIEPLVEESTFKKPEAIKKWNDSLIICDQNKIISVDPNTGSTFDFVRTGNAPSRVTTASPDINENVIATDFTANEVYVMSKTQELVGGLFVQIEQIDASSFPKVNVELRVENRHRQPVVGLQQDNFFFTENKRSVSSLQFVGAASNNRHADISLIIDRSTSTSAMTLEMETAVQEIATAMNNEGTLRIISAGAIPVIEYEGSPSGAINFSLGALKNKVSDNVNLDLAFRLATNDLVNAAKKRSIILLSDGNISKNSFTRYGLNEITSYMNNNSIGFSMIQLNQSSIASELNYIIDNTQGDLYYVFRPEGLNGIIDEIINQPYGIYQFSYGSSLQKNFGQSYLPLEIEVFLLNRSGRDETGYFAPLE
ncbi:MAG: hypothetical protein GX677_06500, partial [Treponema sp.]|nr:hypothetical protein [Treponema sp.]